MREISLHDLIHASGSIEVIWFTLESDNHIIGKTLAEADLRAHTGASVVAISRKGQIIANPKSITVFKSGDRVGFIGDKDQILKVEILLAGSDRDDDIIGVEWET